MLSSREHGGVVSIAGRAMHCACPHAGPGRHRELGALATFTLAVRRLVSVVNHLKAVGDR
jgi:hypothetical protein